MFLIEKFLNLETDLGIFVGIERSNTALCGTEAVLSESFLFILIEKYMIRHDDLCSVGNKKSRHRSTLVKYILKFCYGEKIRAYVVPKITDIIISGSEDINLFDTPLFLVKGNGPTLMQLAMKRLCDIILCIIALIPGLPIMLVVAIMIKLDSKGPVFFRQERITRNGNTFEILKFRSMIEGAEKDGVAHPAEDDDPRITRVGKRIRKNRIDELPQIFNILKGDMSIVGPRPERLEHYEKYSKEVPEFYYRTKVKGGLTGYAQIYGKYNTSPYDKVRLDLMYIENYSLILDLKLILMTLPTLMKRESTEGFDKVIRVEEVIQLLEEEKNGQ